MWCFRRCFFSLFETHSDIEHTPRSPCIVLRWLLLDSHSFLVVKVYTIVCQVSAYWCRDPPPQKTDTQSTAPFVGHISLTAGGEESHSYKKVKEGSPGNHDVGYICVKAISEWRGLGRVKEIMSHIHHSPNPAATHTHAHTQTHTHTHTPLHVHLETNENCYRLLIMSSLRKVIGSYFFWKVNNLGNAKISQK